MKVQLRWKTIGAAALLGATCLSPAFADDSGPVKIGIDISLTGSLAEAIKASGLVDQLWEKEINARGGLLGRKVELSIIDNKSSPENGVSIYQRFLDSGTDFIFEDSGSLLVQRESTLAEQHHKLFLSPNGFASSLYQRGYKYLFYTGNAVAEDMSFGLVGLLKSLPPEKAPKTVGYISVQNIAFVALVKGLQNMLKPLGLKTVLDVTYSPAINDASPLVENLKQAHPDIIVQSGLSSDTLSFLRGAKQLDLKYSLMATSMTAAAQPNFATSMGDAVEGAVYGSPWEPEVKTTHNAEFIKAYKDAYGFMPTYNAAQTYARWQILEEAVNATKTLDQTKLRDYIAANSFDTVVGTIKYNGKGYMTPKDTIVVQFQKGKRVIVWPKDQANGTFEYPVNAK